VPSVLLIKGRHMCGGDVRRALAITSLCTRAMVHQVLPDNSLSFSQCLVPPLCCVLFVRVCVLVGGWGLCVILRVNVFVCGGAFRCAHMSRCVAVYVCVPACVCCCCLFLIW
jgi:hypothetical protein